MIVPGGGFSRDGKRWISCPPSYLFPVKVLSALFRRLLLDKLVAAHAAGELRFFAKHARLTDSKAFTGYLRPLRNSKWVVYQAAEKVDSRRLECDSVHWIDSFGLGTPCAGKISGR